MKKASIILVLTLMLGIVSSLEAVQFNPPDVKINSNAAGSAYNGGLFTCDNRGRVYAFYNSSRDTSQPWNEEYALQIFFNLSTDHGSTGDLPVTR